VLELEIADTVFHDVSHDMVTYIDRLHWTDRLLQVHEHILMQASGAHGFRSQIWADHFDR
jgi:hypothetical protein